MATAHCHQTGVCLPGGQMPAPASCPAHSLSAASSSGFESCPPLQRLLTSIQQAGHQDDKSSRPLPCPGGGGGAAVSPGLPGERTGRRAPQEKGPAGPGTRLLTPGPVTAAGCRETRKHLFQHRGHVSGRFRHAAAPGRPRPARPRGAWTGWAIVKVQRPPPQALAGPLRPELRAALTDLALGESMSRRASAPLGWGPPAVPGRKARSGGRGPAHPGFTVSTGSGRACMRPHALAEHRGKTREAQGSSCHKGTPAAQKGPAEPASEGTEPQRGQGTQAAPEGAVRRGPPPNGPPPGRREGRL